MAPTTVLFGTTHNSASVVVPRSNMAQSNRQRAVSDFDISLMPANIFRRTLHPFSVHHSLTTSNWIATITRSETMAEGRPRHLQFPFVTEHVAKKFCKSYAPPKTCTEALCMLCSARPSKSPARHCRNCGVTVCDSCCTRWGARMVPKTYLNSPTLQTVTVCKSCDWLSNAFCMALLQGRIQDAIQIHDTGNVNLRTSFADIHREAMFPIHCAVMGANLAAVQWLVETHLVPISVARDKNGGMLSVQTSACRTLLDLAMTGRPKADILVYLVQKGLSIQDVKDPSLSPRTLETLLKAGLPGAISGVGGVGGGAVASIHDDRIVHQLHTIDHSSHESVATIEDACILCCDQAMNCAFVPCGHQVCCEDCGKQLNSCPVCKVECSVLKLFRQ